MAGKRLLDAAKLFNAGRSVAGKHFAIRREQWEVYSKTSSLAKAVKSQTDRVTVTAGAAYELTKRFSETSSTWQQQSSSAAQGAARQDAPPPETETGRRLKERERAEAAQEEHYSRPRPAATSEPQARNDLDVEQKKAERFAQPDGSIPPTGTTLDSERGDQESFDHRPEPEPVKTPLADHADSTPAQSRTSTIPVPNDDGSPSSLRKRELQRQSEGQIPQESSDGQTRPHDRLGRDTFSQRSDHTSPELSSLPRMKVPRHREDEQQGDEPVQDKQLNQDVYPAPGEHGQRPPEQDEELPQGINLEGAFTSPRVSSMINRQGRDSKNPFAGRKKMAPRPLPEMIAAAERRKQDALKAAAEQKLTTQPAEKTHEQAGMPQGDAETHELAASIAQDAEVSLMWFVLNAKYGLADSCILVTNRAFSSHRERRSGNNTVRDAGVSSTIFTLRSTVAIRRPCDEYGLRCRWRRRQPCLRRRRSRQHDAQRR